MHYASHYFSSHRDASLFLRFGLGTEIDEEQGIQTNFEATGQADRRIICRPQECSIADDEPLPAWNDEEAKSSI